jgi:5-carboxymethyl-2-hydroxymuconate isomerase
MPHISVEATPRLAEALNFPALFRSIHRQLAGEGHGRLEDFKSRVVPVTAFAAGEDEAAEFLVARLVTTTPRPPEVQRAMAKVVHDVLAEAIAALSAAYWWQCCVLNEAHEPADYFKTDSHQS